jgi:predicted neutral ceramidase superfamily lipid hydrolase
VTQFVEEIRQRATQALDDLAQAQAAGDEYRVRVHTGELESFARLASENGVHVPELAPYAVA